MSKKRPTISLLEAAISPETIEAAPIAEVEAAALPPAPSAAPKRHEAVEKALSEFHADPDVVSWVTEQLVAAEYWGPDSVHLSLPASMVIRLLEKLGNA